MENGSLSDIVEQFGVFPEALSATYIYQVLLGLQFLHSKNVIHKVMIPFDSSIEGLSPYEDAV